MAKFDGEAVYHSISVHPAHCFLLGMKWHGHWFGSYYWPLLCPIDLQHSCRTVEQILLHYYKVSNLLHYLDDFSTAGPPDSPQCAQDLSTSLQICKHLSLLLHPGKCVRPTPVLTVLGIELNSLVQVAWLLADKFHILQDLICLWLSRKWSYKQELESLIGHLHYASCWTFLCHEINLLCYFRRTDHPIELKSFFLTSFGGTTSWTSGIASVVDILGRNKSLLARSKMLNCI